MARRANPLETRARELCFADGIDPDSRIPKAGSERGQPAWCAYSDAAKAEKSHQEQESLRTATETIRNAGNHILKIIGQHETQTIEQMATCAQFGNVVAGVLCADGHLGYAQPVGGVIAYENQISISGVGYDIGCGNLAVQLDVTYPQIADKVNLIAQDISKTISFGVGRKNSERVEHALFDYTPGWNDSGMEFYKKKAQEQLGTVGSGNHYCDLFRDENDYVWIGVHFGSRGLGHTTATKFLKEAGGKEGVHVAPTIVDVGSDIGYRYLTAMELAGLYAYAGREWVVNKVRGIIGANIVDSVHNHHNYAWKENHNGKDLCVVRKGATPSRPGQRGFVGGSMGDDAVIIQGLETEKNKELLYSTIHGAGRICGRAEAKRRFTRQAMDEWIRQRGVTVIGADLDESPMSYRRLPDVLAEHEGTIAIEHRLRPFVVIMAGAKESDPFKD
jgi:tRNA-splicing ligase RtcB